MISTTVPAGPLAEPRGRPAWPWARAALALGVCAAAGATLIAARTGAAAPAEPSLLALLRLMAVLKAGMALGAAGLAAWRLRWPAGAALAGLYALSCTLMAAAPALIWQASHVAVAAATFYAGLLLFLVLAYADRDTAGAMLDSRLQRRSATAGRRA